MHIRVDDMSQVGEARRVAASAGRSIGFDDTSIGYLSIIVTELATNLIKHVGLGEVLLRVLQHGGTSGLEIISIDKGPGLKHIGESLRDGYSTSGSLGTGLGAVLRLSSFFDIYSTLGQGTVVVSQLWPHSAEPPAPCLGSVCLPVPTENECGDAWSIYESSGRTVVMAADGLGHGYYAAEASNKAVSLFHDYVNCSPKVIIEHMHVNLRDTRGTAVGIAEILWGQRLVRYSGLGNISGRLISDNTSCSMVSRNGTVGFEGQRPYEFTYPWPHGGILVLHSDGLRTHWDLNEYPGLSAKSPPVIAGVLFRDFGRIQDDSTVVVIKEPGGCHERLDNPYCNQV